MSTGWACRACTYRHDTPWSARGREHGYLVGLDNLIELWSELEAASKGGEAAALQPDVEWYLSQQMTPRFSSTRMKFIPSI